MPLIRFNNVLFSHGGPPLLDGVSFSVEAGEHIGLLGRNGVGKSTLLQLIAGELHPDDGVIELDNGCKVARLIQDVPDGHQETVFQMVAAHFDNVVERPEEWEVEQLVLRVLSKMSLDGDAAFASLSSGMKRRVLLARTLVDEPDVLLLDEPTNHLDIEAISWLERFLKGFAGAVLFVTHDRAFLQALANRIIEIERARIFDFTTDYATFLQRREELLAAQAKEHGRFDKKLAEEEVWIRKGIKARRTRNEGRVRALEAMRQERKDRRRKTGNARLQTAGGEKSGQLVMVAEKISFGWNDDDSIIRDFSTVIMRGDRIGIVGPNGTGKTTLLKILLGKLAPKSGSVRQGTNLQIAYFDQLREAIDEEKTVIELVGEGQDQLMINGVKRHIYGYLQDFLFTPERARRPARFLSGGERNRLILARIFKRPSNLLIMDEPTNDLDAETLELLEELLIDYPGTLMMVSHDRAFLDNVVTSIMSFDDAPHVVEYDGGYDDYCRAKAKTEAAAQAVLDKKREATRQASKLKPKKLTWKQQQELDAIPQRLEELESKQAELHRKMADPAFFKQDGAVIADSTRELAAVETDLAQTFERWQSLEAG
jgi:ATP-binding cassette subfamily F protein uup